MSPEDKNDSFQRLSRFAGSRKNLSICRALVLIDMSNTFSPNSTTKPPSMLGSIWHMQRLDVPDKRVKIGKRACSCDFKYLLFKLDLFPLSNNILQSLLQFLLFFRREGLWQNDKVKPDNYQIIQDRRVSSSNFRLPVVDRRERPNVCYNDIVYHQPYMSSNTKLGFLS